MRLNVKLLSSQCEKELVWFQSRTGFAPSGGPRGCDFVPNCAIHLSGDIFPFTLSSFPLDQGCGDDPLSFGPYILQVSISMAL